MKKAKLIYRTAYNFRQWLVRLALFLTVFSFSGGIQIQANKLPLQIETELLRIGKTVPLNQLVSLDRTLTLPSDVGQDYLLFSNFVEALRMYNAMLRTAFDVAAAKCMHFNFALPFLLLKIPSAADEDSLLAHLN